MSELAPPLGIPAADWAATPPSVRAVVLALLDQQQRLQARVTDLEAQLKQHSGNSSRPPSSDPPSAPLRAKRTPTGRARGGQVGHPGHQREVLPTGQVDELVVHRPIACPHCQTALPQDLPATAVLRHQVWEVPPIQPHITEHQFPTVCCPYCQTSVRAPRPPDVPPGAFGPRVAALVSLLHGRYRVSTREITLLLADLWHIPISGGSVAGLYQTVSTALAPVYSAVQTTVQAQGVVNVDETPWREDRRQRYLWVATTVVATLFLIGRRSRAALESVLGWGQSSRGSSARTATRPTHIIRRPNANCAGHISNGIGSSTASARGQWGSGAKRRWRRLPSCLRPGTASGAVR